jgi:hypothetical protein
MVYHYQMEHMVKQINLFYINQTINYLKLVDPNNNTGLIGFWNNIKLHIEKL